MRIYGLYAITPEHHDDRALLRQVRAAVAGGVRQLQYRCKNQPLHSRQRQALLLADYCREHRICFIVNDSAALAQHCTADGVHLGGQDGSIAQARRLLGKDKIIGASCRNCLATAQAAADAGADYVAMGAVFPSRTKPDAAHCPLPLLSEVKRRIKVPLVAIGGITPDNAESVIRAGADALAVSRGLFAAARIRQTASALSRWFPQ